MNPMNSKKLDQVLDTLAKIGQKHIKKSESMFSSININDEMIKIAAKQVVLDPIEKKLRTGYLFPISKEKEYMFKKAEPFTAMPPSAEEVEKEKKKRIPGSAMSKFPSGSESNTPYVGEQHGGDQVPASVTMAKISARTIGPRWKKEIKRIVDEATKQGMTGIAEITDYVHGQLPSEVYDIWESAHSQIEQLVNDYIMSEHKDNFFSKSVSDKGVIKTSASKALKDVIQELKQEDRIFADVSEVIMRLNQKGQQSNVSMDELCKTLADNGITLIKKAGEDVIPGGMAEGKADTDFDQDALNEGMAVEMEHTGDRDIAKEIAKDHLTEDKEYYRKLKKMEAGCGKHTPFKSKRQRRYMHMNEPEVAEKWEEKTPENVKLPETKASFTEASMGFNIEAASVEQIKERLDSARESRSYNIERLQEKGLSDAEKDKYEKAKRKWEKDIDRLDRELSRAMKKERKEEREKDKAEKAEQQAEPELTLASSIKVAVSRDKMIAKRIYDTFRKYRDGGFSYNEAVSRTSSKMDVTIDDVIRAERTDWSCENDKKASLDKSAVWSRATELAKAFVDGNSETVRAEVLANPDLYINVLAILQERYPVEAEEFAKMVPNPSPAKERANIVPRSEEDLKRTRDQWQEKSKGQPQESREMGGDMGVGASANEILTVYAGEPMSEPTFELEKFMSPAEYQELQKMLDMRERTWEEISKREERNIQEGLPAYSNIDYSEVEVINTKIQQYQDVAKSRKGGEGLPPTPEVGEMGKPETPGMPEEPTMPMGEEGGGVLDKRPLPEFASRRNNMEKKAVTCEDFPHVCKNCKALVIPMGYNELSFLDHKEKPFCTETNGDLRIGFRYAFARECRGYDPIMKEVVQKSNPDNTETIFEELKERGEQPILKKKAGSYSPETEKSIEEHEEDVSHMLADEQHDISESDEDMLLKRKFDNDLTDIPHAIHRKMGSELDKKAEYEDKPKNEYVALEDKKEADKRGKSICTKCVENGYFKPRGEVHPVHDWHSLWNCDFNSVAHSADGVCLPKSMAYQSQPEGGPNQFDTEKNRIVKTEKKASAGQTSKSCDICETGLEGSGFNVNCSICNKKHNLCGDCYRSGHNFKDGKGWKSE